MMDPRYAGLLGEISFVNDQMSQTGCTRDEARDRWDEMQGTPGRSRAVDRMVQTMGVSAQDAIDALLVFQHDTTSAGEVIN